MKEEIANMLNYEDRNCKYASLWKRKLQECLIMKIETATMLNNENRNCKYAKFWKWKLQVCLI